MSALGYRSQEERAQMVTTKTAASTCPQCGHKLDAATSFEGATPSEGSVTVCIECGRASVFNADLSLRAPTPKEKNEIDADPGIHAMRRAIGRLY